MDSRESISAILRRRLYVEAGHRCAIPTCLQTPIDLHHIIPWEKCKEHSYDNLIALCPTCHRRADRSEIDRQSLFMYKARLQSLASSPLIPGVSAAETLQPVPSEIRQPWITQRIEENRDHPVAYVAQIDFPRFDERSIAEADELNTFVRARVLSQLLDMRRLLNLECKDAEAEQYFASHVTHLAIAYSVTLMDLDIISLNLSVFEYHAGAAHPNHSNISLNYHLGPLRELHLDDFFVPESKYLEVISSFCANDLCVQFGLNPKSEIDAWIQSGTAPSEENFEIFNLTNLGFVFTFKEYQVASYAQGAQKVVVPYQHVRNLLRRTCAVQRFVDYR